MICQDLYLKYTPANGGAPVVRYHRVWDKDRFLKARIEEGASKLRPEEAFTVMPADKPAFSTRK